MRPVESDLEIIQRAFRDHGQERDLASLRWQYIDPPLGSLTLFAEDSKLGDFAAMLAAVPIPIKLAGNPVIGAQAIDLLVAPHYRGRGLFATLAKELYAQASDLRIQLLFGFPNGNAAHGWFERYGWSRWDPVPYMIRPLRLAFLARQLARKLKVSVPMPDAPLLLARGTSVDRNRIETVALTSFDAASDALWEQFSKPIHTAVRRDSTYLKWRMKRPNASYVAHAAYDGNELTALMISDISRKGTHTIGHVLELFFDPRRHASARRLLGYVLREMYEKGADVAVSLCLPSSPSFLTFVAMGFVPLPRRLRDVESHFGGRLLDCPSQPLARNEWYVSYLDSYTN
jgi:GNAT superfamily N-acetyltransferase